MHTKQDRNNQWTIACVWNKKNLGVASQIARWWPLNPVHWFQWRLEQRGRCSHKLPIHSKNIKLNMNVQMLAVSHYLSCSISEATTNLSREPERSWMMVASWLSVCSFFFINWRNGVSHCANRPSRNTYRTCRAPWPPEQPAPARWDRSCSICPWVYLHRRWSLRPAAASVVEAEPGDRKALRAAPCSGRTATTF